MKFHSLNFQLQAMVITVIIGSALVLSILYKITRNISSKTDQLSKSAELNTLLVDWQGELKIGTRSRIKYIELNKPIFLTNYLNSILRIHSIYDDITQVAPELGATVSDSLDVLWKRQMEYRNLAESLKEEKRVSRAEMAKMVQNLENMEFDLNKSLEHFIQIKMVQIRNYNLGSLETTMKNSRQLIVLTTTSFMIFLVLIWYVLKRKILAPLKVLERGAKEIGEGALGLQVEVNARGEIGDLVEVLNRMSIQLKKNQDMEVKFQKLETIDQMVTTVSHEINNPLMIIGGNAEYISKMIDANYDLIREKTQKIIYEVKNLCDISQDLLPEEELHKLNNPLMVISGYVEYLDKMYQSHNEKVVQKLNKISFEVRRIFEVTQKLKGIKNPVVEKYVGEETTMIDLKKSS